MTTHDSESPIPVPGPTASPKAVRKARQRAHLTERQHVDAAHAMLDSPSMRRLLYRWLDKAGVLRDHEDIENTNRLLRDVGRRSMGLFILIDLLQAQSNALEVLRAQYEKDTKNAS